VRAGKWLRGLPRLESTAVVRLTLNVGGVGVRPSTHLNATALLVVLEGAVGYVGILGKLRNLIDQQGSGRRVRAQPQATLDYSLWLRAYTCCSGEKPILHFTG